MFQQVWINFFKVYSRNNNSFRSYVLYLQIFMQAYIVFIVISFLSYSVTFIISNVVALVTDTDMATIRKRLPFSACNSYRFPLVMVTVFRL